MQESSNLYNVNAVVSETAPHVVHPHLLDPLLRPTSVAFIGASNRPQTLGNIMVSTAAVDGYPGALYPVNPKESMISGLPCFPDIASIPGQVEHVVIGLADQRIEQALHEAIEKGVRAATIFTGCDMSDQGDDKLLYRLSDMAREAGLHICGPNSMGLLNPTIGLRLNGYASPIPLKPGNIALILQSGSAFSALAYNHPRLRFSFCVSTGRELATRSEDYMLWALEQPETKVIGLFQETARDPARFITALERARQRSIPVVVLKVGKTELSAHFASSHSGAIAGDAAAYEAVFRSYGVVATSTLDEFGACLQIFSKVDAARLPDGLLAGVHDSGGEREMVVDLAEREGVFYADISKATKAKLSANLDSGLKPENPLDVWGSGHEFERKVENCMKALIDDPATGALALFQDIRDGSYVATGFLSALRRVSKSSNKPAIIVSNYAGVRHGTIALEAVEAGLPVIEGSQEGLKAIRELFAFRDRQKVSRGSLPATSPEIVSRWRTRLSEPNDLSEAEALALIADYGIATPRVVEVDTLEALRNAVPEVGLPLVLKTAAPGIKHKSDVAGVFLGLTDMASIELAYREIAVRLGPQAILEEMLPSGIELAFGLVQDETFGPFVIMAAGGIWIEALEDRVVALPPFDQAEARGMIDELRIRRQLGGGRGVPPADLDAIAQAFSRFSQLAADLGDLIFEMDVNPLFARADGIRAVDALLSVCATRTPNI
ncbi:acetate--CoA ligase family protein [Roseovarius sp. 217]|uniref:acetate--CoA ligase family protein n=1 Tax=Roseovarius sp. (strain 217) TaxID=314264 RepID=UPI00006854F1|nr:acetate--CoA ligase family protein [Roseovarius sp. 217]EAQ24722.1 acetyl-CoA synthetase, putative [Roseovarius sp. 217]